MSFLGPPCSRCTCKSSIIWGKPEEAPGKRENEDYQHGEADHSIEKDDELTELTKHTTLHDMTLHVTAHDNGATITSL